MSFYKYFLCMIFIALNLQKSGSVGNKELCIRKRGIKTIVPSSTGLVFFVDVNNTSNDVDFEVVLSPDECCVDVGTDVDCELIEITGDCVDTIRRGTTKTLELVAPLIDPYERTGYCLIYLDSKPKNRQRGTMRDSVKINFDTRLINNKQSMKIPENVTKCKNIDEDPLNDCKPVDCETYYNGRRSYFDRKSRRCVSIPSCVSDNIDEEVPDNIYESTKNKCIVGKSVKDSDINSIKDLTGGKDRKAKDILIIKNLSKKPKTTDAPPTTTKNKTKEVKQFKEKDYMLEFDPNKFPKKISELDSKDYKLEFDKNKLDKLIKNTGREFFSVKYFIERKWTLLVFGSIILVQCCLICTMSLCITKKHSSPEKKKVERKYFNYRQDASVTTPLICTSNIDTETTEFQYLSEGSNIDKKIKCYKACQKERKNNMKMSMSDDILAKCLTRRDWNSNPVQSKVIPEVSFEEYSKNEILEEMSPTSTVYQMNASDQTKKVSDAKVNFENEKPSKPKKDKKQNKIIKSIVKRIDSRNNKRDSKNFDELCDISEKEIKCHSYNNFEGNSNVTGFKPSSCSKKLGFFEAKRNKKGTTTVSTEKGAQAAFSNDSIDDYLSERGLIFLAGENLSKYSFSSHSNEAKSASLSSEVSSKTSKNHVVKNILSLLRKKSTNGPSSDPGGKVDDLEVIHVSHASVYSSNLGSDLYKSLKIPKESRSSM